MDESLKQYNEDIFNRIRHYNDVKRQLEEQEGKQDQSGEEQDFQNDSVLDLDLASLISNRDTNA